MNVSSVVKDFQSVAAIDENCIDAIERLVTMRDPRVEILLAILDRAAYKGMSTPEERKAAWGLGELKNPSAVEPLIMILLNRNNDHGLKLELIEALGKIGSPKAINPILEILDSEDGELFEAITNALCQIGSTSPDSLWGSLEFEKNPKRRSVLIFSINRALSKKGKRSIPCEVPEKIEKISGYLNDRDPKIRLATLEICLKLDKNFSSGHLYGLLYDDDEMVIFNVIKTLIERGDIVGFKEFIRRDYCTDRLACRSIPFFTQQNLAIQSINKLLEQIESSRKYELISGDDYSLLDNIISTLKMIDSEEATAILETLSEE